MRAIRLVRRATRLNDLLCLLKSLDEDSGIGYSVQDYGGSEPPSTVNMSQITTTEDVRHESYPGGSQGLSSRTRRWNGQ